VIAAALALAAIGQPLVCRVASVHDGDTMRCADGTRIRLQGIDANELDGSCHNDCAQMPAETARARLETLALGHVADCRPTGTSYRRIVARCSVAGSRGKQFDLSCAQVTAGAAVIWRRFDPDHRLDRCLPGLPPVMVVP
jgi:endonuclease YncB( thermonuclease family)